MPSIGPRTLPASPLAGASRICCAATSQLPLQHRIPIPRSQQCQPRRHRHRQCHRQPGVRFFTATALRPAASELPDEPAKEPPEQKPTSSSSAPSPSTPTTSQSPAAKSASGKEQETDCSDAPASAANKSGAIDQTQPPTTASTAESSSEPTTNTFGRARAWKSQKTDSLPPTSIPAWFMDNDVVLVEGNEFTPPSKFTGLVDFPGQTPETHAKLRDLFYGLFLASSFTDIQIDQAKSHLGSRHGPADAVAEQTTRLIAAAAHVTATLSGRREELDLDELDPENALGQSAAAFDYWFGINKGKLVEIDNEKSDVLNHSELLRAVRAGLMPAPQNARDMRTELRRPISVLTCPNSDGSGLARTWLKLMAAWLAADIVHLDALSLAEIAGAYLGQTQFWSRGNISMLGYDVMERNGRTAPRYPARSTEDTEDEYTIKIPRIISTISRAPGAFASRLAGKPSADERWEDLKLNRILEDLIRAPETKRSSRSSSQPLSAPAPRQTIIHIHNFVELSLSAEGQQILNILRSIVDRLWQKGQQIILIGSSASTSLMRSPELKAKLEELGRQDCHMIPFKDVGDPALVKESMKKDIANDNLRNIRAHLTAMAGTPVELPTDQILENLLSEFSATVYDVQWVYRFVIQLTGETGRHKASYTEAEVRAAIRAIRSQDRAVAAKFEGSAPYFSPLVEVLLEVDPELNPDKTASSSGNTKSASSQDSKKYDEHEKKLLPNLINAEDIRVTFDDIICPPETKESLQALTSLSLTRPDAFLYGILASERIPGCLLYGPPGTGKTMIAKAIAKQSGANMLDISAASINDMWVGNSEKNVRALFSLARKLAPTVIFIDEADAMLGARGARPTRSGHREVINQFLREWDGLTDMRAFIMVATNRPFDLDEAVLRRLPRRVLVDLPMRDARLSILKTLLKDEIVDETVSLEEIAAQTELYSGSDLKNVCVAAALEAVKEEVRASKAHAGPEEYKFPDKRILSRRHVEKGLREIGPSINEDMASLKDIRKFDERYGDAGAKKKKRRNMGFHVGSTDIGSGDARIRQPVPA